MIKEKLYHLYMETNYYARKYDDRLCKVTEIHIGKSLAGWNFALHIIPSPEPYSDIPVINNLDDWRSLLESGEWRIFDEYGEEFDVKNMMQVILDRLHLKRLEKLKKPTAADYLEWKNFESSNCCILNPKTGLWQDVSDRCVGHGETYDLWH